MPLYKHLNTSQHFRNGNEMTITTTILLLTLAILLGKSLDADASQEAQLSRFMASRAMKRLASGGGLGSKAPDEIDPWADPASSFAHLPERLKKSPPPPPRGRKEADRVTRLPGQPPGVRLRQYAGYVTVDDDHRRELFYYFAESPRAAACKPLILWLNGGPGCSSLGYGAMSELGPFRVNPDGKTLSRNRHAWNNLANVIFLESPAGVGFSFSRNATDYATVGDGRTAEDSYVFLVRWLERFPEYKSRDFYIAGESYGGHYVPELAVLVTAMNRFPGQETPINLQGIFVGNPLLDVHMLVKGNLEYLLSHGVISDEIRSKILAECTFTASGSGETPCYSAALPFEKGIYYFDIYAPVCHRLRNGTFYSSSSYEWKLFPGYDPCIFNYTELYLNNLKVKKALHARISTNWSRCNKDLKWNDAPESVVPIIKRLVVDHGLRVWIYSGDFDSACSLTSTRYSIKDLNLNVMNEWRPWYTPDSEVGGYVQQYQGGFTLASVRGAGHMVPTSQPKRSLVLLYSFLKNMLPPADIPN
ncbi:hypothetical protein ACP4OV_025535 [Aristida adscensionis]